MNFLQKNVAKLIVITFITIFGLFLTPTASAQEEVNLYFFWGKGCPHCAKEEELLKYFQTKYSYLRVHSFEVYTNYQNMNYLQQIGKELNERVDGVPFTIIGDKTFVGYLETMSPSELANRIEYCYKKGCPDSVGEIVGIKKPEVKPTDPVVPIVTSTPATTTIPIDNGNGNNGNGIRKIHVPLLGEINPVVFSLPLLTVVMGALDGFNPCAMWALVFLISLLLGMKDRKRMWILGSVFIIASAGVYFLFMAAWLNLILFLGFIIWIRIAIAALALYGGIYHLKEFFTEKDVSCKVTGTESRQKIFARLKDVVHENSFWLALGGIILLAAAVNLVELICSAGLPAIYTQVLALNDLAKWQYYLYILGYIFFFMLDDLLVFFVAMTTLQLTGMTTKYVRVAKLVGGVLMVLIGILLIFKPEWLTL